MYWIILFKFLKLTWLLASNWYSECCFFTSKYNLLSLFIISSSFMVDSNYFLTITWISSNLFRSGTYNYVNFDFIFNGSSFFPISWPGFIQPMILNPFLILYYPFSSVSILLFSNIGNNLYNNSLLARFISSNNNQWPLLIAFNKFPSIYLNPNWLSILSFSYFRTTNSPLTLSIFCFNPSNTLWSSLFLYFYSNFLNKAGNESNRLLIIEL